MCFSMAKGSKSVGVTWEHGTQDSCLYDETRGRNESRVDEKSAEPPLTFADVHNLVHELRSQGISAI